MNTSTTSPETPANTLSTRGFTEGNYEDLIKIKADRLKKLNEDLQIDKEDLKIYLHEFYPYDEYRIKKLYANDTMSEEDSNSDKNKPKSENDDGYGKDDYEKDDNDSNGGVGGRSKVGMFNPETGEFESFDGMDKFGKNPKPKKTNDFVVRAFGIVKFPDGREHSISFDVLDFKPYFYIKIPDNWTKAQFTNLIMKLKDEAKVDPKSTYSYANGLIKWEIYTGKPFYGFTADDKFQYGKLIFENSNTFKKYSRLLETLATHKSKAWAEHVLYESNIEPQLRLIHIQEITPSGWIKVPAGKYRRQPYNSSDCEFHFELSQTDIIPLNECSDIPKLKVAAFDIESDSSHGDFPIAAKNYRKLSQDIITEFLKLPADQIKNIKNSHHIKALIHTWISLAFNPYYDNNNISKIVTKNDEIPSEETLEYLAEKIKDLGDQYHQTIMDIIHHGYNPNKVHGYKEYYIGKLHLELEEHLPELDMERIGTGNYQLLAEQLLKENHRMMEGHKKVYLKEPLETIKFWLMLAYHPYYDQHNISHVYNVGKSSPTMAKLENLVPQIYSICMECYWELNKPKEKKPKSMAVIKPKKFMVTPPQAGQTKLTGLLKRTMESRKSIETDGGADGSGKKAGEADKKKKKELAAVADKKKKDLAVATESDGGSGYKAGGGKEEEQLIFTRGRYVKPRPVPYPDPDNPEKMKIDKIGRDFFVEWLHELFDHHLPDVLGDPVIQIGTTFKMYGEKELYLKHIITLKGCAKFTNEQMIDDENKDIFITKPKDALAEADSLGFTSDTVKSIIKILKEAEEKGIKKPEIPKEEIQQINTELYLARRNKQMARDTSVLKVECYNTEAEVLLAWKRLIKEQDPDIITGYNIFGFDFKYMWDRAQVLGIIEDFSDLGRIRRFPEELVEKKLVSSGLGDNLLYYISMTGRVTIDLLKVVQSGGYRLPIYKLDFVCNHFLYKRKNDLPPQELFILQKGSDQDRAKIARYCLVDCILCNRLLDKLEIITNNVGMSRVCKVPLNYLFLRGQGIKIQSLVSDITRKEGYLIKTKERITGNGTDDWFEGAIVLDPAKGIYFEPCVVADFNSLYPSCMIAWNLSHDSYIELGSKYDNLPEGQYYDVKYDLYREEKMPGRKVVRRVKYGVKTCRYYQPADGSKSMLPRILQKLLKARKSTREEQEAFKKGTFEWNVKEGLQLAYKVTANSLYGQVGARTSAISFKEIAACTTACGRDLIYKSKEFAETNYEGCQTVYGDSVTGDTPLLLRDTLSGKITIKTIENIASNNWNPYDAFKIENPSLTDKQQASTLYQVWTDNGWSNITRVIRHKTNKKIYRVNSYQGCVDVTEDHSLIDSKHEMVKPGHCKSLKYFKEDGDEDSSKGNKITDVTDLLYSFPDSFIEDTNVMVPEVGTRPEKNPNEGQSFECTGCKKTRDNDMYYYNKRITKEGVQNVRTKRCKLCVKEKQCETKNKTFNSILSKKKIDIHWDEHPLTVKEAWVWGFFMADGSCGKYGDEEGSTYASGTKHSWAINNQTMSRLEKAKEYLEETEHESMGFKILDTLESSAVYKLVPTGSLKYMVDKYRALFYDENKYKIVPQEILNATFDIRKAFFEGYYEGDGSKTRSFSLEDKNIAFACKGKIGAMGLYYLAKSIGMTNIAINTNAYKGNTYWISTLLNSQSNRIRKVYELPTTTQFVYDLETSLGRFHAGVGGTIVSNTDSCFFRYNTVNCRGEKLFGLDAIYKSIELCTETALGITRTLPKPHNLEFEKAIWPFMLLSKKRYHGHYWTKWGKCDYYPNSMGIVLKRRDNAKIVKHIFGGVLDIIMEEHDIKKAIEFCKVESAKLLEGKFPIEMFTITKTLKSYYKNPDQIAHNVLAQRIAERDPGNRVQSNDRMEFAYIKLPEPPKGVKILQGDKIETPQFIKTKDLPLDYRHYLTNQVMKPVTQIFELVLDEKELAGIFGEALMEYDRRASGFQRITKWVRQIPIFPDPEDDGDSEGDQDGHGGGGSDEDEEFGNVPAYGIIQKLLKQLKKEEEDENAEPGHFEAKEGDEVLVH